MARDFITSENALGYLEQIRDTMISEGCNISEASAKVGVRKADLDNYMEQYHKSDEYVRLEEEIATLNADITFSKYVRLRLEGNPGKGYQVKGVELEQLYETVVLPRFSLTGEALEEYKSRRPLLDFDAVAEYYEKHESGELFRSSVISRLNNILLSGDRKTLASIKTQISQYDLLKKDEEIIGLLSKIDGSYKKQIIGELEKAISDNDMNSIKLLRARIQRSEIFSNDEEIRELMSKTDELESETDGKQLLQIQKYIYKWATMIYVEGISERLSGEVLKIASLNDDEVSSKYPRIDIQMLRRAAERIEGMQGKTVKEQKEIMREERDAKKRAHFERLAKIKDIVNGGFYDNGITTQEQFDTFLSSIPSGYTKIIQNAQNMWKLFNKYMKNSSQELTEERESLRKELDILPIYRELIDMGIFADFEKMKNKTFDELEDLLEIAKKNPDKDYNRRNYIKTNLLSDIIIDSESKDDYLKQDKDTRHERIDRHEERLLSKIRLIYSVLLLREQENNSQEQEKDNYDNIIGNENEVKTAAQKLTNVFLVLKEYGISLAEIKIGTSRLGELISDREDVDEIMEKLQAISEEINKDWKIGEKLNTQKRTLDILKNEIEKSGIILTDEEENKIFGKKMRLSIQEFVKTLQILKKHNIDLSGIKIGVENQSVLSDLIEQREDKNEILTELQKVSKDIGIDWRIGGTLLKHKYHVDKLADEIEKSGLILSQEEKHKLIEKQAGLTSEELVQALIILKQNGINISDIKARSKLNDLLNDNVNGKKIINELQDISSEIDTDWSIGSRLSKFKGSDKIEQFKLALEKSIGDGAIFTEEEIHSLLDRDRGKDTSNSDYIIGFMRKIVSERRDSIGDNVDIEEMFDATIKAVEKGKDGINKE